MIQDPQRPGALNAPQTEPITAGRIRFVEHAEPGEHVLLKLNDPSPCQAVITQISPDETPAARGLDSSDVLEVLFIPQAMARTEASKVQSQTASWVACDEPGAEPPVFIKCRGADIAWRPGRAVLQCDADQREALLEVLVEFSHYEAELRRIERQVGAGWSQLDLDKPLANRVTKADLARSDEVSRQMNIVLAARIRNARIEPHLLRPASQTSAAARTLGHELREKTEVEERLEIVDGQLEVYEYIYEMISQRMGEFQAAHDEHKLEWLIIVILVAETLILLTDFLWRYLEQP